jgi:hypothetical protein
MTTAVRLMPAGVEEAQFKRVTDGWLFTVANPWIIAPRVTYLVSDAQKPAIVERLRRARYVRPTVMLATMLPIGVALFMDPTLLDSFSVKTCMVYGAFVMVVLSAILAADYLTVRPLIRDLPRTSQKISRTDMARSLAATMSPKWIMFQMICCALIAGLSALKWFTSVSDYGNAISALIFAPLAVVSAGMLIAKLRSRKAEGAARSQ